MAEIGEVSIQTEIPEFKRNWVKLKDQLPGFFHPFGWKDTVDTIALCWRDNSDNIQQRIGQLSQALTLEHIPQLELNDAVECCDNTKKDWAEFTAGIKSIVRGEKLKWGQMKKLAEIADNLAKFGQGRDEQAIALLRAINETHREGRTPEEIRRKIAQSAFDEIFQVGEYRILDYTGADSGDEVETRITQDGLLSEKDELVHALKTGFRKCLCWLALCEGSPVGFKRKLESFIFAPLLHSWPKARRLSQESGC